MNEQIDQEGWPVRPVMCRRGARPAWLARVAVAVIAAVGSATTLAAPATAHHGEPSERGGGYVWASNATAPLNTPYLAPTAYSQNTVNDGGPSGGENTVTRTGTGVYKVRYHGLGVLGGTVNVTAYGTGTEQCKVSSWGVSGDDQVVWVRCFTLSGNPVNTRFVSTFTNYDYVPESGRFGYLWASVPTSGSYTPPLTYQHNSSGGINTIERTDVGNYVARLPGLGVPGGHVQVTAYGAGSERCKVASWWELGTTEHVRVRCFTAAGAPADTRFTLTFAEQHNIIGAVVCCVPNGRHTAYAWANNATAGSYTLSPSYTWTDSHPVGEARGTRVGTGRYSIKFYDGFSGQQGDLDNGNVAVTAYGSGSEFCKIVSWTTTGGITVWCFNASGAPVDTRFTVTYVSNWILG